MGAPKFFPKNQQAWKFRKALSVSVLNQAVSSGTNFVLGLYLVRVLTPANFGLYSIGFAIGIFFFGIGNSLFLTQMVVHTPGKSENDRMQYAANIFFLVFGFSVVILFSNVLLTMEV